MSSNLPEFNVRTQVTASAIIIEVDGISGEFLAKYKDTGDPNENVHFKLFDGKTVNLSGLQSNKEYQIHVFKKKGFSEEFLFEKFLSTEKSLATYFMENSDLKPKKDDKTPDIYRLKAVDTTYFDIKTTTGQQLALKARECKMLSADRLSLENKYRPRTIMFIGQTGTGKSTMIDAIVNYIAEVSPGDPYRFEMVQLTDDEITRSASTSDSQTEGITCYQLPYINGSPVKFALKIIDMPGFSDTKGRHHDNAIPALIQLIFEERIESLEAICLVVQKGTTRLSEEQNYVFDCILKIFGKDITDNICIFMTFDDGGKPQCLEVLERANVPCKKFYRFNNAELYQLSSDREKWEKNKSEFRRFFDFLNVVKPKPTENTKQVYINREQIRSKLALIQPTVAQQVSKIIELESDRDYARKLDTYIKKEIPESYTKTVPELILEKCDERCVNCTECKSTCHIDCSVPFDAAVRFCVIMSGGNCTVCKKKCSSSKHNLEKLRWNVHYKEQTEYGVRIEEELNKDKITWGKLVDQKEKEVAESYVKLSKRMSKVVGLLQKLHEIALKADVPTVQHYLTDMIEKEDKEKKPGWNKRIEALKKIMDQ